VHQLHERSGPLVRHQCGERLAEESVAAPTEPVRFPGRMIGPSLSTPLRAKVAQCSSSSTFANASVMPSNGRSTFTP